MKLVSSPPAIPPQSPEEVAAVLTVIAAADRQLACAIEAISLSSAPVSCSTVLTLERLLFVLRPAADERLRLSQVAPDVLHAGLRMWAEHELVTSGADRQTGSTS